MFHRRRAVQSVIADLLAFTIINASRRKLDVSKFTENVGTQYKEYPMIFRFSSKRLHLPSDHYDMQLLL